MVIRPGIFPWLYSTEATHLVVASTGYEYTQLYRHALGLLGTTMLGWELSSTSFLAI